MVVAIVVEAVLRIGGRALRRRAHLFLAALAFVSIYFLRVPFPLIVLSAGLVGLAGYRFWPDAFAASKKEGETPNERRERGEAATVIDDHAPPPPHTLPSRSRALKVVAVGALPWALPFALLVILRGSGSLHAREYLFFTQAAFVTFGGAYAVFAYVTQAAAGPFGWVTQAQAVAVSRSRRPPRGRSSWSCSSSASWPRGTTPKTCRPGRALRWAR